VNLTTATATTGLHGTGPTPWRHKRVTQNFRSTLHRFRRRWPKTKRHAVPKGPQYPSRLEKLPASCASSYAPAQGTKNFAVSNINPPARENEAIAEKQQSCSEFPQTDITHVETKRTAFIKGLIRRHIFGSLQQTAFHWGNVGQSKAFMPLSPALSDTRT